MTHSVPTRRSSYLYRACSPQTGSQRRRALGECQGATACHACLAHAQYLQGTHANRHIKRRPTHIAGNYRLIAAQLGFQPLQAARKKAIDARSEEHTSELQSLMRISYAVFCLKKKKPYTQPTTPNSRHNPLPTHHTTPHN